MPFTGSDSQRLANEDLRQVLDEALKRAKRAEDVANAATVMVNTQSVDFQKVTSIYQLVAAMMTIMGAFIGVSAFMSWKNIKVNLQLTKNESASALDKFKTKIDKHIQDELQKRVEVEFVAYGSRRLSQYTTTYANINLKIHEICILTFSSILESQKAQARAQGAAGPVTHAEYLKLIDTLVVPASKLLEHMLMLLSASREDRGEALIHLRDKWLKSQGFPIVLIGSLLRSLHDAGYLDSMPLVEVAEDICKRVGDELRSAP